MLELQQLKKVRLGQDPDPDEENDLLSLLIQSDVISPTIRVPKERFNGITDPIDHATAFESHMDFYGASNAIKCRAFSATFRGWQDPDTILFLLSLLQVLNTSKKYS